MHTFFTSKAKLPNMYCLISGWEVVNYVRLLPHYSCEIVELKMHYTKTKRKYDCFFSLLKP